MTPTKAKREDPLPPVFRLRNLSLSHNRNSNRSVGKFFHPCMQIHLLARLPTLLKQSCWSFSLMTWINFMTSFALLHGDADLQMNRQIDERCTGKG